MDIVDKILRNLSMLIASIDQDLRTLDILSNTLEEHWTQPVTPLEGDIIYQIGREKDFLRRLKTNLIDVVDETKMLSRPPIRRIGEREEIEKEVQ